MRAAVVELEPRAEPIAAVGVGPGEEPLGVGIAGPEQHQLHVPAEDALQRVRQHVEALLRRQPADHAEERHVGAHGEAGLLLQRRLACGLAGHLRRRERLRQVLVGGRVPLVGVDAVQDADQIAAAGAQDAVEAVA